MTTEVELLPDSMSSAEVHQYAMALLSSDESVEIILKKLDELADLQWHTYETPNSTLQLALCKWLSENWNSNSQPYLEAVLGISYCFGLDKEFYTRALALYSGEHIAEFKKNLTMSVGHSINPWWSVQMKNA